MKKMILLLLLSWISNRALSAQVVPDSIVSKAEEIIHQLVGGDHAQQKLAITSILPDTLFVECYSDKSRGGKLSREQVSRSFDQVFDDNFFGGLQVLSNDPDLLRKSILYNEGNWFISFSVQYAYEEEIFPGNGYSRIFNIDIVNSRGLISLVHCAG